MSTFAARDPAFEARVRDSFAQLTLMRTIGARLVDVLPGEVVVDLPFRDDLTQHHGFLAGAAVTAIADVACGYAAMTLMSSGASVLTVEYKANFVAPARGDRMVARARVLRPGRTLTVCAADVVAVAGGRETLVTTMLATIVGIGGDREPSRVSGDGSERMGGLGGPSRPPVISDQGAHRRHRSGRSSPRWCVCGGRGVTAALRDLVRFRPSHRG